ncbi:transglycosylase domain-containing protein [Oenococcus kitaharae]|uniref:Multimodular transpeptidase-transglycosylase n=1 Tax=Oenococcus kitaharae DSM 17330 TaxID=1045004 RepID=G9WFT1_9LACO|nr:transglycosylase domain-containing protein [Oenococcus kitaharae]EHN59454.1 Multimodular transpeptidase-transglycosylase [Oenococcus kitaharae DSM 17330]
MSDNSYNPNNFHNNYDGRISGPNESDRDLNQNPINEKDAEKMFPDTNGRRPISFGRNKNKNGSWTANEPKSSDFHFDAFSPADQPATRPEKKASASNLNKSRNDRRRPSKGRPKKKRSKIKLFGKIAAWCVTIAALGILAGMAVFFTYAAGAPKITESDLASETSTQFFDAQGNQFYQMSQQERDYADQSEIPESLMHAVVSIEDRRFYKHHGVDLYRTVGALVSNLRGKLTGSSNGLQGGSTLTQQLVKLSVFSTKASDQTLKRKAQEAWLALKVERNFSKNQILTFYINKVPMGNGIYGMKTGAEYYFNKSLKDLDASQTAILAGIPRSPVYYDPYVYPDNLRIRRNEVLASEVQMGYLSKSRADQAMAEPIQQGLVPKDQHTQDSTSSHLMDSAYISSVLSEVRRLGYDPEKDGLKIYTALNPRLQQRLYTVLNGGTGVPWQNGIQAAATVTNPKNGRVVAQIGGRNNTVMFGRNRAVQTNRSSGSTAKPIVDYGPAIEYLNWPTYRTVQDNHYQYPGTNIDVHDFDGRFLGNMTMRHAIAISRNIPAIHTLMDVGMPRSSEFLNKIGIPYKPSQLTGSSAIGIDVSTEQEAAAFAAFSNGGTYYKPQYVEKIITADGITHSYDNPGERAMKESTAFMMTNMLQDVPEPTGSAPGALIPGLYQAGKSGIVGYDSAINQPSGAESDVWFTGYTKNLSASFWVGFDEPNKPGNYIPMYSESSMPERAYHDFMIVASQGYENTDWQAPSTVQRVTRGGITEYEVKGAKWSNGGLPNAFQNTPSSSSSSAPVVVVTPPASSSSSSSSSSDSSSSNSTSSSSSSGSGSTPPGP